MLIFQLLFMGMVVTTPLLLGEVKTKAATVYFSPEDQLDMRLIELINQEKRSISICVYSFTHQGIADALIEAHKRGVEIEVTVDRFSMRRQASLKKLSAAGIAVYVWDPDSRRPKKSHRSLMHNKFCILGGEKVWVGSLNFTHEAARIHQENAVVIHDAALAAAYRSQFLTIKMRACTPFSVYVAGHAPKKGVHRLKIIR